MKSERALVTQMLEVLESGLAYVENEANQLTTREYKAAIKAAREYLATEPRGERAELIAGIRHELAEFAHNKTLETLLLDSVDMLEADAQPKQVTCQIYGHVVGACVECNTHIEAQQAKRVPLSDDDIDEIALDFCLPQSTRSFARAIEAHHGITPANKPTDDEPEDLYALALKADNWGQP